ncbi:MAG: flagellar export chaperone FlgN [Pirellulales bacterium]|nr:flagellar export chaperone FlgN [Pirellulales bacterium]
MDETWDAEFADLLAELSATQGELLEVLQLKRTRLGQRELPPLDELQPRETELVKRLQTCQDRRQALLDQAQAAGNSAKTLRAASRQLPPRRRQALEPGLRAAQLQARLLQHQAITNWVLAQKTLIHLSQMLEIIATGGQPRPTYDQQGSHSVAGGVLLNELG